MSSIRFLIKIYMQWRENFEYKKSPEGISLRAL
jgi:hypothetical protein